MKKVCWGIVLFLALGLMAGCGEKDKVNDRIRIDNYVGVYMDEGLDEPGLTISKNNETYDIEISIYRLAIFDDGVGELTSKGLHFTATDPAENLIEGLITIKDDVAVATFTNSTWTYIKNGESFEYVKVVER